MFGGKTKGPKQEVKRTPSKIVMKHLLREGWTMAGIEAPRQLGGTSMGGSMYVLTRWK